MSEGAWGGSEVDSVTVLPNYDFLNPKAAEKAAEQERIYTSPVELVRDFLQSDILQEDYARQKANSARGEMKLGVYLYQRGIGNLFRRFVETTHTKIDGRNVDLPPDVNAEKGQHERVRQLLAVSSEADWSILDKACRTAHDHYARSLGTHIIRELSTDYPELAGYSLDLSLCRNLASMTEERNYVPVS